MKKNKKQNLSSDPFFFVSTQNDTEGQVKVTPTTVTSLRGLNNTTLSLLLVLLLLWMDKVVCPPRLAERRRWGV